MTFSSVLVIGEIEDKILSILRCTGISLGIFESDNRICFIETKSSVLVANCYTKYTFQ